MNKEIKYPGGKRYTHLFFDLDHTLWDFEANSRVTLLDLFNELQLGERGVHDFDLFDKNYLVHNDKLWDRYRNGYIKVDELRWKRMWLTLLDFKIADEPLARKMGVLFLDLLPTTYSATDSAFAPVAGITFMPRASQAGTSMLSRPTPRRPTTRHRFRAASSSPRTWVRLRTTMASALAASARRRAGSSTSFGS